MGQSHVQFASYLSAHTVTDVNAWYGNSCVACHGTVNSCVACHSTVNSCVACHSTVNSLWQN